jgi:flagellar motility protein MotE (MotC chaperone)
VIRRAREFRLVPVVVVAAASLLALKTAGLFLDGSYTLGRPRQALAEIAAEPPAPTVADPERAPASVAVEPIEKPAGTKRPWADEMFGYPDYTGSSHAPKPKPPEAAAEAPKGPPAGQASDPRIVDGKQIHPDRPAVSPGERAVLESLNQRRLELEARARELEVRADLLAAAEKRIEGRLGELKEVEARISAAVQKKDEADAQRLKGLIVMYDNMKAKDAAKIFDRLDMRVLLDVATQLNPRRMSDILAQMQPEAAERLTVAIANRQEGLDKPRPPNELPKIEGRPSGT